jgi:hypothetical protein
MAELLSTDVLFAVAIVVIAVVAIWFFTRAANPKKPKLEEKTSEVIQEKKDEEIRLELKLQENRVKIPPPERKIQNTEVDRARSRIRTLTIQQEIDSLVLKRLYEAEDEGELNKDERIKMAKPYEVEMQQVSDELKRSEMLISLSELESIREEMIKKFEDSITQTQIRIDVILKELKLEQQQKSIAAEEEKIKPIVTPKKRRVIKPVKTEETPEEDDGEETTSEQTVDVAEVKPAETQEKPDQPPKQDVESRLSQLKKDVMKELDELDKLELEA